MRSGKRLARREAGRDSADVSAVSRREPVLELGRIESCSIQRYGSLTRVPKYSSTRRLSEAADISATTAPAAPRRGGRGRAPCAPDESSQSCRISAFILFRLSVSADDATVVRPLMDDGTAFAAGPFGASEPVGRLCVRMERRCRRKPLKRE